MVSSPNLLPTIFSDHWPREPCTRTPNRAPVFPATIEGPRPDPPSLRLLMRHGSCWPCWGTSAKDSRGTKNSRALIWPLLTLLTCGHPSHSGAMQEEMDLVPSTSRKKPGETRPQRRITETVWEQRLEGLFSRHVVLTSV